MISSARYALGLLLFSSSVASAQKLKKGDKVVVEAIRQHIVFLADDQLEGRRAGTKGEQLAADYIIRQFESIGLQPKAEQGWQQTFPINDGKDYKGASYLFINGNEVEKHNYFVHALSPDKMLEAMPSIALQEAGVPWVLDLNEAKEANSGNPHFDMESWLLEKTKAAAAKGATALLVYNDSTLTFQSKQKGEPLPIPLFVLNSTVASRYLTDETATLEIKLKSGFVQKERTGRNVIGYMDNGAPYTIVIGAHFDHLGYGEDGNSMLRNGQHEIHNGADDNASGTAALIELGRMLKKDKKKTSNYLLVAFSGEELGLFGSKYFTEHATVPLAQVNYMINMDMVGRLNDSSHGLTIGGYGTSPEWATTFSQIPAIKYFQVKYDSSGTGPSDHTSFYRKDIPVLFFFTGLHTDYHKPTDDAPRINAEGEYRVIQLIYQVIRQVPGDKKLAFTKTREQQTSTSSRFSVTMGIMPDYSFSGTGVRVDGVSEGRPAKKAGLLAGDIILQLGEHPTADVEAYMQALGKFKKGDKTTVKYKRAEAEMTAEVEF
ncbi:M28 family peptidase [Flavihumibacter petaseus]|uniref:Peptidase M28 family protein n=1 Tax=Flavihumibacter petaseus NBRC 106054 TaxID=1220578 RepID=A0A0E9MYA4_9BACT|nr:M28 family peptidase [Flavihumibacter petaseus]GAO42391.1 peptidase M28 family protein [Flavihumibacter petaseus NBRC 106054]